MRSKFSLGGLFVFSSLFFCAQSAYSVPLMGPTGNAYEFVQAGGISWASADSAAQGSTFNGVNGHLATIFTQAENDFVLSLLAGFGGSVWLGGSDAVTEGQWYWVTGEKFWEGGPSGIVGPDVFYANWIIGLEPNNCCGGEDHLTMFGPLVGGLGGSAPGLWNDLSYSTMGPTVDTDFYIQGYVVEYENTPIPEPASVWLIMGGLVGLAGSHSLRKPLRESSRLS